MRLPETRDRFRQQLSFPTDYETVLDQFGDEELEAPTGDTERIGDVLERTETGRYGSADELYDDLVGSVGDPFVGRKFYDDRGSIPDDDEVSF